ncbi:hypothetical protein WOLCODRAFT_135144 [Wolfiporia cocos MD-104 SS10]|uniref:Uncharacterized protein n=1 Tax=Wolfiporia cocos (strain MD-104) TaxID=742152 RepID=A0A2H3ITZ7_WOLCO|nr:hypothetical protein WOLCODRAFT_135144 [Wolfiporia cocos MD-104 SS10]
MNNNDIKTVLELKMIYAPKAGTQYSHDCPELVPGTLIGARYLAYAILSRSDMTNRVIRAALRMRRTSNRLDNLQTPRSNNGSMRKGELQPDENLCLASSCGAESTYA